MATRQWIGNAAAIAQVSTITIANTWATDDKATIGVNGKELVVTVGANTSTDQVATSIKQAFENATLDYTPGDVVPERGKFDIAELSDITATVSGSVVTLEASTAGNPFTVTANSTTAGNGTATLATTTAATGPNHFDNGDNWFTVGGAVGTPPTTTDTLIFDSGSRDCKYGLSTGIASLTISVKKGYTGGIGLPQICLDNFQQPYQEYRTRHLTTTTNMSVDFGGSTGQMGPRVYLSAPTITQCYIYDTGFSTNPSEEVVQLVAGTALNVNAVVSGSVALGKLDADNSNLSVLQMLSGGERSPEVLIGAGCQLPSATITINAGILKVSPDVHDTFGVVDMTIDNDAVVDMEGGILGVVTLSGEARLNYRSPKAQAGSDQVTIRDRATLDFSDNRTHSTIGVNTIERYSDLCWVIDPRKIVTSLVIDQNHCSDTTRLVVGANCKLTRAAVS